jgi:hypothetical protein
MAVSCTGRSRWVRMSASRQEPKIEAEPVTKGVGG